MSLNINVRLSDTAETMLIAVAKKRNCTVSETINFMVENWDTSKYANYLLHKAKKDKLKGDLPRSEVSKETFAVIKGLAEKNGGNFASAIRVLIQYFYQTDKLSEEVLKTHEYPEYEFDFEKFKVKEVWVPRTCQDWIYCMAFEKIRAHYAVQKRNVYDILVSHYERVF